jgi:hypothetical protein
MENFQIEPNWKQFSQLTWTTNILPVLEALGVADEAIPSNGRPRQFATVPWDKKSLQTVSIDENNIFIAFNGIGSRQLGDGSDVLAYLNLRPHYRDDKALRRWLRLWGWTPPHKKAAQVDPTVADAITAQQACLDRLDELYRQHGRQSPDHPMHGLYTGLVEQQEPQL